MPILLFLLITAVTCVLGYVLLARLPESRIPPRYLRLLEWICRYALALVFLWAAVEKGKDPYAFAASIYAYRVVPPGVATVMAIAMPAVEILAALALMTGFLWRGSALVLGGLLLAFSVALFQAILRGIDISCGCFGKDSSPVSFWLIARNALLVLAALFALRMDHRRASARQPTSDEQTMDRIPQGRISPRIPRSSRRQP